jgi:hypothetical protein
MKHLTRTTDLIDSVFGLFTGVTLLEQIGDDHVETCWELSNNPTFEETNWGDAHEQYLQEHRNQLEEELVEQRRASSLNRFNY